MHVVGIIPARLQSTRLPRKLLLNQTGKPLIQYAWEAACRARSLDDVIVATDSEEIAMSVRNFGGRAELTGGHPSGTDRVAEVARRCCPQAEIVVNIQGDEPETNPDHLDQLVAQFANGPQIEMATLATRIADREHLDAPSCVKVVCNAEGRALYFSRCPIPYCRDQAPEELLAADSPWLLHVGVYAYRRDFLLKLTELPPSRLEQLEKLEQLRALEAGAAIQVARIEQRSVGIDTPDDYAQFVARQHRRAA